MFILPVLCGQNDNTFKKPFATTFVSILPLGQYCVDSGQTGTINFPKGLDINRPVRYTAADAFAGTVPHNSSLFRTDKHIRKADIKLAAEKQHVRKVKPVILSRISALLAAQQEIHFTLRQSLV